MSWNSRTERSVQQFNSLLPLTASLHDQSSPSQRANAVRREPELQAFWDEERIYERVLDDNTGEKYVLHDGPPYANGDLHIGHALNKVSSARPYCARALLVVSHRLLLPRLHESHLLVLVLLMFLRLRPAYWHGTTIHAAWFCVYSRTRCARTSLSQGRTWFRCNTSTRVTTFQRSL